MDDNGNPVDTQRTPLTVMVAEKQPIARAALAALLSYDGYRVFQADSPKAAISHLNTVENFAVLLVDLEMPDWRAILRHAIKRTDVLIIAMAGYHPISELCDLTEHGIQVCLQKPIIYKDVQRAISENIGPRQPSDFAQAERISEISGRILRKSQTSTVSS